MNNIDPTTKLYKIIESKKAHLEGQKRLKPQAELEAELASLQAFQGPNFFDALKSSQKGPKIIAEVKKASPSKGIINQDFSLLNINEAYQSVANVVAISVLTETDYFQGSDEVLSFFSEHNTNNKPLLRKDFIFDPYQVVETKLLGAQAYLLIASLFETAEELEALIQVGREIGLEALVEVHTHEELELVKATSAQIVGVNCRDMKTLDVNLDVHELLREIDDKCAKVAESGIDNSEYLNQVTSFCDAALIGGHLMEAENIKSAIETLIGVKS